jgi:hypothetical protein
MNLPSGLTTSAIATAVPAALAISNAGGDPASNAP